MAAAAAWLPTSAAIAADVGDLQSQIDYVSRNGGPKIQLPPGDIRVDKSLILRPGSAIVGAGRSLTRVIAAAPAVRVFDKHEGPAQGSGGLEDLTVVGFGYAMPNRGDERDRTVVLGPFEQGWCRNVEVHDSRWVSITGAGIQFEVSNCYVHHGFRDGIQLNNVETARVLGNVVDRVADDAIACHVGRGQVARPGRSITIMNNRISRSTGIKCLGASNAVISHNSTSMVYGYALFLGVDNNFGEGLASETNIRVEDNEFSDTLSLSVIGAGRGLAAIYLSGGRNGQTGNDGKPIIHSNIALSRNKIIQTISHRQDDFGLWWTAGAYKESLDGDVVPSGGPTVRGIMFSGGDLSDISITGNRIVGLAEPILFEKNRSVSDVRVSRNAVINCARHSVLPPGVVAQ